jgi:hypothetical protein
MAQRERHAQFAHELGRGEGDVVRAELWSEDDHSLAFTNPIYTEATRGR